MLCNWDKQKSSSLSPKCSLGVVFAIRPQLACHFQCCHLSSQSLLRQTTRTLLTLEEHPDVAGFGAVSLVLLAIDQSIGGLHFAISSAVALCLSGAVVGLDLGGPGHFRLMMVDLAVWDMFCFDRLL
jgi:hypothetical protein